MAVLNGMSVAGATQAGMVTEEQSALRQQQPTVHRSNMFVQDDEDDEQEPDQSDSALVANIPSLFNPEATSFVPTKTTTEPGWMMNFGKQRSTDLLSPDGPPPGLFGQQTGSPSIDTATSIRTQLQKIGKDTFKSPFGQQGFIPNSEPPTISPVPSSSTQTPSFSFFNHSAAPTKEPTPASPLAKDKVFSSDLANNSLSSKPAKTFFDLSAPISESSTQNRFPDSSFSNVSNAPTKTSAKAAVQRKFTQNEDTRSL